MITLLSLLFSISVCAQGVTPPKDASPEEELAFWEELAYWETIKESSDPAGFEDYLIAYPEGRFARLAKIRIQLLKGNSESTTTTESTNTSNQSQTVLSQYAALSNSNVRDQPSTNGAKIGVIRQGELISVIGPSDNDSWLEVRLADGRNGYVFAALLKEVDQDESANQQQTSQSASVDPNNAQTSDTTVQEGVFRDCAECPQMVTVPAGQFIMGAENQRNEEKPAHKVTIPQAFAIAVFEVTIAEWDACRQAGGCDYQAEAGLAPELPIGNVSWDDAQQYVKWLSEKTGAEYRLPSEAEWEYAARAGSTANYWWGDDKGNNLANCKDCGSRWDNTGPAPVGSFKPNAFGLYDTQGNVWEWTMDCYNRSYKNAPVDGSAWTKGDCLARMQRGGAWNLGGDYIRTSRRGKYDRDVRYLVNGFRVAKTLP